jgi:hypothetical protein
MGRQSPLRARLVGPMGAKVAVREGLRGRFSPATPRLELARTCEGCPERSGPWSALLLGVVSSPAPEWDIAKLFMPWRLGIAKTIGLIRSSL